MTTETTVTRHAIQEISASAQQLIGLFRSMNVGDVVTYATANAAAGLDVKVKRYPAYTAIKRVLIDDSIHIATVRGVGFKRLSPAEAAATLPSDIGKSRRAAKRGLRKAQHVSILDVPAEKRMEFVAQATLCSLIGDAASAKGQAKLAAAASTQPENTAILAQRMALDALKAGE